MSSRSLRVLCVDDEPAIVAVARQALTREGHTVTALTSTVEALEAFRETPSAFDVVVSDESMPKMAGTSFIAALRAIRPSIGCVLMTGMGDEATHRRALLLGDVEIIDKPFSLATLVASVERAAARSGL